MERNKAPITMPTMISEVRPSWEVNERSEIGIPDCKLNATPEVTTVLDISIR
jgi:hypothetical protein